MNKRLSPLQHTTISCTVHKPDVPVIRLELKEVCKIFCRVLLSPTFSGRQETCYLFTAIVHDYEKTGEKS
jgi:hypothetical protein